MPKRVGKSRRSNGKSSKTNQQLKTLVDISRSSINQSTETVPDVPRMRLKSNKVYTFSRSFSAVNLTAGTSVDVSGSIVVSLNNLPNYTEITNLFDEYRIMQVVCEFLPFTNTNNAPPLYTAIDPDDGVTPTSADQLRQLDTCRIVPSNVYFERTFTPMVSAALYTGSFTGYGNIRPTQVWIDNASPNVQHYGLKYYWPAMPSATGMYALNCVVIIQCRHLA